MEKKWKDCDLTSVKNGNRMRTKTGGGGLYGKNLFGQNSAEGSAGFAYVGPLGILCC